MTPQEKLFAELSSAKVDEDPVNILQLDTMGR